MSVSPLYRSLAPDKHAVLPLPATIRYPDDTLFVAPSLPLTGLFSIVTLVNVRATQKRAGFGRSRYRRAPQPVYLLVTRWRRDQTRTDSGGIHAGNESRIRDREQVR